MALGRREAKQTGMWVAATELPRSPGHGFYEKLNRLLADAEFDRQVEDLCRPYYDDEVGRPSIPPGVYFRMLFIGYFESLNAQRAIAWKCADSLSIRTFLGLELSEAAPDHSSLTRIRQRLPLAVHMQAFTLVLEIARAKGLLRGKTLAVDATTLEANAAMKSMVHRVTGEHWKAYLRRLAKADGIEDPTDDELRRFDRRRKGKKVSNDDWASASDTDARIMKMKDGRTHFAYKAEHAVDVESGLIVSAEIYQADEADGDTVDDGGVGARTAHRRRQPAHRRGSAGRQGVPPSRGAGRAARGPWGAHLHSGAAPPRASGLGGQTSRTTRGRLRQPPPLREPPRTRAQSTAQRARGAEFRAHLRDGRRPAHLVARAHRCGEALLGACRSTQSRRADARAARYRDSAGSAGGPCPASGTAVHAVEAAGAPAAGRASPPFDECAD